MHRTTTSGDDSADDEDEDEGDDVQLLRRKDLENPCEGRQGQSHRGRFELGQGAREPSISAKAEAGVALGESGEAGGEIAREASARVALKGRGRP